MTFDPSRPILSRKQNNLSWDEQDGTIYLSSRFYYTRLDQALLLWAIAVAIIFFTAQFHAFDWHQQAKLWSCLSLVTLVLSSLRAWPWAAAKNLRWLLYGWAGMMLLGLGLTDYGIYGSVSWVLLNLCPIWLGLCGLAYGITALAMGSRALLGIAGVHGMALGCLSLWPAWLFGITGGAIAGCLLLLAQLQWDHA